MAWTDPIDAYCERTSAAFWAEPVNAATNLAFLGADAIAVLAWRRRRTVDRAAHRPSDRAGLALAVLVAVIGIGSFLFHTFADRWSVLADVVPIAVFINAYFALALFRFGGLSGVATLMATLGFLGLSFLADPLLGPLLGSSAGYGPALLALLVLGGWLTATGRPAGGALLLAALVFCSSLAARMADGPLCGVAPLGTHFLWHILNAGVLLILVLAAIRHGARTGRATIRP